MEAYILQHRLFSIRVGKGQIVQRQVSIDMYLLDIHIPAPCRLRKLIHDIRFFLKNSRNPLKRRRCLAEIIDTVTAGNHGPDQHADIGIKCHKLSDGHLPRQNHLSAEQQRHQKTHSRDGVQCRTKYRPKLYHGQIFLHAVAAGFLECLKILFFLHKSFQHPHPRNTFLYLV